MQRGEQTAVTRRVRPRNGRSSHFAGSLAFSSSNQFNTTWIWEPAVVPALLPVASATIRKCVPSGAMS